MSKSLSIKWDPIDQPVALDPLERRTWCALSIRIRGRLVTRIWDKARQEERTELYLPAFPIAEWIVSNWWALLNEPSPTAELPKPSAYWLPWIKRHCLRCAESGLLLPALYLFNDGRGIRAEWHAEQRDALPNMPGDFVDSGCDRLENVEVENGLAEFVSEILQRTGEIDDDRVEALRENWLAIRGVDAEEARFCIAAGRMGLDPYEPAQMRPELVAFLETVVGDPDLPVARDLTEAAEGDAIIEQWSWVQKHTAAWKLGAIPMPAPLDAGAAGLSPSQYGHLLAAKVRNAVGLGPLAPVASVEQLAQAVSGRPFHTIDENHVPGNNVRAVVGWTENQEILVAGPHSPRRDNRRFLEARGLYHALFACDRSERLVTRAFTWDQQASRAFAAELLAPQAALLARYPKTADSDQVEALARHFDASKVVIEKQLENAGATLLDE